MSITLNDLDGKYEVQSQSSYNGPMVLKGDGTTEIKNGLTYRKDKSGCIWESSFSVIGPDKVQIESTIDPSHAGEDIFILDEKGNPTKAIVTFKSVLDAKKVNGKVILSGDIQHGKDTSRLLMTQI